MQALVKYRKALNYQISRRSAASVFSNACCRKTYHLQFSRCDQDSCGHCRTTPVRAERFLSILQKDGDVLPTPTLSLIHKGHYDTMLHQVSAIESIVKNLWALTKVCLV